LGQDAFGLMAFVLATYSLLSLLDLGLAATANREVARETNLKQRADLVRTLESIYWGTAFVVFVAMLISATFATGYWLNLGPRLTPAHAWTALALAGLAIAIRWPVALYSGVLQGLENQVHASLLVLGAAMLRIMGGIVVAAWVSPTVTAVFIWYIFSAFVEVSAARYLTVEKIGRREYVSSRFRKEIVLKVWKVAAGFSLISALGALGANLDKLLLSRYLNLADLGYYSSIAMLAGALTVIGSAVAAAIFPRLARAFGEPNEAQLLRTELSDALTLILWGGVPVVCLLIFARVALVEMWTGVLQENAIGTTVLVILSVATFINAFVNPFYTAAMASGRTVFLMVTNAAIIFVLIPSLWFFLPRFGLVAAASSFLFHNVAQLICLMIWFTSSLPDWRWWRDHVIKAAVIAAGFIMSFSFVEHASHITQIVLASLLCIMFLGLGALLVPALREILYKTRVLTPFTR
jgi:O-antigen/teichoic acid export membrane protein